MKSISARTAVRKGNGVKAAAHWATATTQTAQTRGPRRPQTRSTLSLMHLNFPTASPRLVDHCNSFFLNLFGNLNQRRVLRQSAKHWHWLDQTDLRLAFLRINRNTTR